MSQFSTKRDEFGLVVPYGKGAMRLRRQQKRQEAEARQQKAILQVHPNGVCDCKKGRTHRELLIEQSLSAHEENRKQAAEKSDVVKKTRRAGKK